MRKVSGSVFATCSLCTSFLLGVAAASTVACGSSAVSAASSPAVPSAPAVQADEFYISPTSDLVFSLDVAGLRASPYFKHFESKFKANIDQVIGEFSKTCGFDPMVSIKTVAGGLKVSKEQSTIGSVIIRGVTKTQITPCLEQQVKAGKGTMADGVWRTAKGAEQVALTFLAPDVALLLMQPTEVSAANLAAATSGTMGINTSSAFSQMWASAPAGQLRIALNGRAPMFDEVRSMGVNPNTFVGSTMMAEDMTLAGTLTLDSAQSAKALVEKYTAVEGIVGGFVKSINLKADKDQVLFSATITPTQTDSLIGMAGGF